MRTLVLSDPALSSTLRPRQAGPVRLDAIRIWTDEDVCGGGVETTMARFVEHRFRPHTHDTLMLGLIEAGTKSFARERETWVAPPGSVSIVNPGDLHTGCRAAGDELRYRALYIPTAMLTQVETSRPHSGIGFRSGVVDDDEVYRDLLRAHEAVSRCETLLAREHAFLRAIGALVKRHGSRVTGNSIDRAAAAPKEVRRAREIIEERYAEELAITGIATAVGMSPYHLMREFRRHIGLPMHAYQIQKRIENAKRLLASGASVVQVALSIGFADQSHFTKRFKDLVGAPPALYQRDVRRAA